MRFSKPLDTIFHLLAARSRGDLAAAVDCYEANATVVIEPGRFARETAIKSFTEATIALPITFGERAVVEGEDIARPPLNPMVGHRRAGAC
jgi:hypothetical protein